MPTFSLDDHEVPFEPGDTIIRAAHRAGIDIPHYCWHPGLSVAANCRMCLVELGPPPGRKPMMLDILEFDSERGEYRKAQKPKLVPACQQAVAEGMQVKSQSSENVRKARAAVQEFLLLNHPVDCPICDQAGECRLQDYWLTNSRQQKRMQDEPIHKPKAVPFGKTIVYDAERCIVCTRCVRVCEELAKDPVLAVRERGNLSEIVLAPGRELDHNYTLMTELVCPVGALTSTDFRFKARVWFLRSVRGVCVGCSKGCNDYVDFDPRNEQVYRYRPRENEAVNGHWMCDHGMLDYARIHEGRVLVARSGGEVAELEVAVKKAARLFEEAASEKIALLLSPQHSQEDNYLLLELAERRGVEAIFIGGKPDGEPDGVLLQADRNPNRAGVERLLGTRAVRPFDALGRELSEGRYSLIVALGSEFPDEASISSLGSAKGVERITLATHEGPLVAGATVVLPISSWAEYEGTYVNHAGLAQRSERAIAPRGDSLPAWKMLAGLARAMGKPFPYARWSEVRQAASGERDNGPIGTAPEAGARA